MKPWLRGRRRRIHVMPSHRLHLAATMDCQGITVQYIVQPL